MRFFFLFLDGVGLGADDPETNPFSRVSMPVLESLLDGKRLVASSAPHEGERASLLALDAGLGVPGLPQSATGQATLLTGVNVPAKIGYHYGPKPNADVAPLLKNGTLFSTLMAQGLRTALLNAYPPRYFEAIDSGRRIYSAIPLAVTAAGIHLKTHHDLLAGKAVAADFTAQGWHEHLGLTDTPRLSPYEAGVNLAELAQDYEFSFFEYWISDYAGHHQDMQGAVEIIQNLDQVIKGLLSTWDDRLSLALITSDHGNLEDLSTRRHTDNPVPALVIGAPDLRRAFTRSLKNLADVAPAILQMLVPPRAS